jgi:hypothetical protein
MIFILNLLCKDMFLNGKRKLLGGKFATIQGN